MNSHRIHLNRLLNRFAIVLVTISMTAATNAQEITDSQKSKMKRITSLVDRAGQLFKSKEYKDSANRIRSAQKVLLSLAESSAENVILKLKTDHQRITKAKKLLEGKGEIFDDWPDFETLSANAEGRESGSDANQLDSDSGGSASKKLNEGSGSKSDEAVSFKKHVAPIIVEHCGKCHIEQSRGKYSAANYVELKKGTRKGTAIKPRDVAKSRLISLIENGAMPPKGEVPEDQLKVLKDWIEQGAKFDGTKKEEKSMIKDFVADTTQQSNRP